MICRDSGYSRYLFSVAQDEGIPQGTEGQIFPLELWLQAEWPAAPGQIRTGGLWDGDPTGQDAPCG